MSDAVKIYGVHKPLSDEQIERLQGHNDVLVLQPMQFAEALTDSAEKHLPNDTSRDSNSYEVAQHGTPTLLSHITDGITNYRIIIIADKLDNATIEQLKARYKSDFVITENYAALDAAVLATDKP